MYTEKSVQKKILQIKVLKNVKMIRIQKATWKRFLTEIGRAKSKMVRENTTDSVARL